jgi:hypothetical protein
LSLATAPGASLATVSVVNRRSNIASAAPSSRSTCPGLGGSDLLLPEPGQQRRPQPVPRGLHRAHLLGQPDDLLVPVAGRDRPEPVELPDLLAVVLDRAARPGVVAEQLGIDLHLARHELSTAGRRTSLPIRVEGRKKHDL